MHNRHKSAPFSLTRYLDDEARRFISKHGRFVTLPKNYTLFMCGDVCTDILWLQEGNIRVYLHSDNYEEISLYTLHPDEQCIVNTVSALSQTPAVATATTVTKIKGVLLDYRHVKTLAHINDNYCNFLFSLYQFRFDALTSLISSVRFKTLQERLVEWLQQSKSDTVRITHAQLAKELGTSRVVVSRALKELEKKGLVQLRRNQIFIRKDAFY